MKRETVIRLSAKDWEIFANLEAREATQTKAEAKQEKESWVYAMRFEGQEYADDDDCLE